MDLSYLLVLEDTYQCSLSPRKCMPKQTFLKTVLNVTGAVEILSSVHILYAMQKLPLCCKIALLFAFVVQKSPTTILSY